MDSSQPSVSTAPYGYDVLVNIVKARNLPAMDWWNGLADPFVVVTCSPGGVTPSLPPPGKTETIQYKTRTVWRDLEPQFDEFFELGNLPASSSLLVEVWDKDLVTKNDRMGSASWSFAPQAPAGKVELSLQLADKWQQAVGQLQLEVSWEPSQAPGAPLMLGPVRYRQHFSPRAGVLMCNWNDDNTSAYSTYKLYLCHIRSTFAGVKHPWNRSYPAAATLYKNQLLLAGVRTSHSSLYSTHLGESRCGVLRSEVDFFALFKGGCRGGQRRYFTYSLMPDSMRCSETGAAFLTDMASKHAMHAGGAQEVLFAGEFCIVLDPGAAGGHRLVIDNNSGTFAPLSEHLPRMCRLFLANFPAMAVETLAVGDPKLEEYHRQCPSRQGPGR